MLTLRPMGSRGDIVIYASLQINSYTLKCDCIKEKKKKKKNKTTNKTDTVMKISQLVHGN